MDGGGSRVDIWMSDAGIRRIGFNDFATATIRKRRKIVKQLLETSRS
jgi:hypothetical protein